MAVALAASGMSAANSDVGGSGHCFPPGGYLTFKGGALTDGAANNAYVSVGSICTSWSTASSAAG